MEDSGLLHVGHRLTFSRQPWTNQRSVLRSRDLSGPITGQYYLAHDVTRGAGGDRQRPGDEEAHRALEAGLQLLLQRAHSRHLKLHHNILYSYLVFIYKTDKEYYEHE